ncbi:cytochrome-c peroxidase [Rufibacter sediminis]|uniref:Cytochrome C peroxidase n=1 Tax=Rufibacter sediminis TaxID=2762756 RepID=A0ABR6VPG9_9BACT|nr:cytochrome c peroxidase [Rufibacter sediminis]MBC3538779.1 cytochrome C peroxidase [Rufibacter sediminis]
MMHKLISGAFLLSSFLFWGCFPEKGPQTPEQVKTHLVAEFDSLQTVAGQQLLKSAQHGDSTAVRQAFHQTRQAYKQIEWFTEYYAPSASRELNGAPLPEIEIEETRVFDPSGLQVIEEFLYPTWQETGRPELVREVNAFLSTLKRTRVILDESVLTEGHILDAAKQEVFRTMILGVSGFDTPLAKTGVKETAVALASVGEVLSFFGENAALQRLLKDAIAFTAQSADFDAFDRMAYINRFATPITSRLVAWQKELQIPFVPSALALNPTATSLFDSAAFNPDFFTGTLEARTSPEKVALGKDLFHNPILTAGGRTCGSCHQPELAFTDGLAKSNALQKGKFVSRNAPTLLYAGLQHAQFYDMRSPTLENQAMDVMANKDEMHASVAEAAVRLSQKPAYVAAFKKAFPTMEQELKPRYVMMALASYVRSLAPFRSRFDLYMRGDQRQMNGQEIKGFNLFMGKAKCGTCHFMPVFNGTAGPSFSTTEGEVLGVLQSPGSKNPVLDPDEGRYVHNKIDELKFAFKTPTVRNIAKTAPYMHNGAYKTLKEVIDFYNRGGGNGLGLNLEHQTLPSDELHLTAEEQKALIAFLHTLTDPPL